MRNAKHLTLAAAAVVALALAGCGGSSKTARGTPDETPPMEQVPAGDQAAMALKKANDAETAAMAAKTAADALLAAAKMKADMLGTFSADGDSTVVAANAQAILDAKAPIEAEKAKAEQAKKDAEAQKAVVDGLAADTPGLAAIKAAIDEAIMEAGKQVDAFEKLLRGPGSIGAHIQTITGADGTGTPATYAADIAKTMEASLTDDPWDWTMQILRPQVIPAAVPEIAIPQEANTKEQPVGTPLNNTKPVEMRTDIPDHVQTWEEIVGAGKLIKRELGTENKQIDVLPLAGMAISKLTTADGTALTALPTFSSGEAESYYMGIKGTLYCTDTSACELDGTQLKGPLYFRQIDADRPYTMLFHMKGSDLHYSEYKDYARYGYWLYKSGATETGFAIYSHSPNTHAGNIKLPASDTLASTATYKGKAMGLSVMKSFDANTGEATGHKSAKFTADVTMNAVFGTTPTLGGTVNNFVGDAADPNWSVELETVDGSSGNDQTAFNVGTGGPSDGVSQGSGGAGVKAGIWKAAPYATKNNQRPTGIIGGFNAHFPNGAAAGGFAAQIVTE